MVPLGTEEGSHVSVTAMASGRKSDAKWRSSFNILGRRLRALNWTIEILADDEFDCFSYLSENKCWQLSDHIHRGTSFFLVGG